MMKSLAWSAFVLLALAGGFGPAAAQTVPGWALVWADEFNQADGASPDPAKWTFDLGSGQNGWGNSELESYTSRTNNACILNGQLVITARKENYTGSDGIARNYTSARLKTQGKWAFSRGRIEARMQLPRGQGIWPAFWMLGTNITSVSWPTCGEIDIMENIGCEPGMVHGTMHGPGYSGANGIGGSYTLPNGAAVADAFHLYALEWETNALRWYVDGQLYFTTTPANLLPGAPWVYNSPQFLLLNLAVGGNWPGNPDASTAFPQQLLVDYVRIYTRTNVSVNGTNVLINPGFETGGLTGWTRYGPNSYLEGIASYPVHGGSNDCKVFGQFTGADNYSGVFQDVPARAGTNYSASAWLLIPAGDSLAGANSAWVEVSFRDAAANLLALYRTAVVDSSTPAGQWFAYPLTNRFDPVTFGPLGSTNTLVAPPGTISARFQTVFHQPQSAAGSVLYDDLSLVQARSPVALPVTFARSGLNLVLTFMTQPGFVYLVQAKGQLLDASWQVLTSVNGDGALHSFSDPLLRGGRYYEVVVE